MRATVHLTFCATPYIAQYEVSDVLPAAEAELQYCQFFYQPTGSERTTDGPEMSRECPLSHPDVETAQQ